MVVLKNSTARDFFSSGSVSHVCSVKHSVYLNSDLSNCEAWVRCLECGSGSLGKVANARRGFQRLRSHLLSTPPTRLGSWQTSSGVKT